MPFEWDEAKRQRNIRKHSIDFVDAKEIWSRYHVEIPSNQTIHAERRWLAVGELNGRVVTVVFTRRDGTRRLISARNARRKEKENYQDGVG